MSYSVVNMKDESISPQPEHQDYHYGAASVYDPDNCSALSAAIHIINQG
jgi:hypothetical protein